MPLRSTEEVIVRSLVLAAAVSCSFGCPRAKATRWLKREGLFGHLSPAEGELLRGQSDEPLLFQEQVEALWALAWAINKVPTLDFSHGCDDDFVHVMPDLRCEEDTARFRAGAMLRPADEIIAACDLSYCLHWGVRDAQLRRKRIPGKLEPWVIVERRRALEWLVSDEDWDDVSLDT